MMCQTKYRIKQRITNSKKMKSPKDSQNPNMIFDGGKDFNKFVILLHHLLNMFRKFIMEGNDQDMLNKWCNKTTNSLKSLPPLKITFSTL